MFPTLSPEDRIRLLEPPTGRVRMVLDTDAFNEVDDQFAVCHAMLSPDRVEVEGVLAAPFTNSRSVGPGDGMEKSYEEINRLLDMLGVEHDGLAYRGATDYLKSLVDPPPTAAAEHIIERAMADDERPLYVCAVGAITNVATAILLEPRIIERIVVVWLGGMDHHHDTATEFNLRQDPISSSLIFDCGVPFVHCPCNNVSSHLITTVPELKYYLGGKSKLCDYLVDIVAGYVGDRDQYAWSKVIWDVATTSYVIGPDWVTTRLTPAPHLNDDLTWSRAESRHLIRVATFVNRDTVFRDLFKKLAATGD